MASTTESGGILALAQEAVRDRLLSQNVLDQLTSLHPQVPNSMKHRYLLACIRAELQYIKKYNLKKPDNIRKYEDATTAAQSSIADDDLVLGPEHLSDLNELLVSYAHKWREIGIALRFQPQDLRSIQACPLLLHNSPKSYLTRVLEDWLLRKLDHALRPTKDNLKRALSSKTVELGILNSRLTSIACAISQLVSPCYALINVQELPPSTCYSASIIIQENMSTLLEVQANCKKDSACEYKWFRDGIELPKCETFQSSTVFLPRTVTDYSHLARQAYYSAHIFAQKNMSSADIKVKTLRYYNPGSFLCLHKSDIDWSSSEFLCQIGKLKTLSVTLHVTCPLDEFRDNLTSMYLSQPEIPEDTWPPVGSKKYINLALIKQQKINYSSKSARLTIRGDVDDVLQDKDMIKYEDFYKSLKSRQLVLIEGRPGSGKTTFVHKISQDWATNSCGPIRLLLLVSLRVMNTLKTQNPHLADILNLFEDLKVSKELVEERAGKGICFIFDGLDEFSPPDGKDSVIYKIINKKYLIQSTVIVASRPAAIAHLMSRADKVIEVVGFLREQILEYFDHYPFSDTSKGTKLKLYLNSHPNILHMCYLPIHAAMVAFLSEFTGEIPKTETDIFTHFTRFTLMRTRAKTEGVVPSDVDLHCLNGEEKHCFNKICQLAFEKTLSNKQVLHQDEVNSFFHVKKGRDMSLGLITVDRTAGLYGFKDIYTFLHLTFQEYLAAYHISTLSDEEQNKIIEDNGRENHMLVVWKFLCGLKKSDNQYTSILDKTKGNTLFHLLCAYESQQKLNCTRFLKSVDYHILLKRNYLSAPDFTALGYIANASDYSLQLTLMKCNINAEAVDVLLFEMADRAKHLIKSLHIGAVCVDLAQMEGIKKLLTCLKSLKIVSIESSQRFYQPLVKTTENIHLPNLTEVCILKTDFCPLFMLFSFENLTKMTLKGNIRRSDDMEMLVPVLQHCRSLIELDLSCNQIDRKSASLLASGLKCCESLERFNVTDSYVPYSGITAIVDGVKHLSKLKLKLSDLIQWRLSYKHLLDIFHKFPNQQSMDIFLRDAQDLASFCRNSEKWGNLEELTLDLEPEYNIQATKAICNCLQYLKNLHKLAFKRMISSAEGAMALMTGLRECPKLQVLDLSDNKLDSPDEVEVISAGLETLINLKELVLDHNKIGDDGAKILSSHFQSLSNLRKLSLVSNLIHREGGKALAANLHHCTQLQQLDLQKNDIDDKTAHAIVLSLKHCESFKISTASS